MPTCRVPTRTPERRGFTLIEALVSVVVAVLLLSVACSTLVVALKSEEVSGHIAGLRAPLSILRTRALLGSDVEDIARQLQPGVLVTRYYTGSPVSDASAWVLWQVSAEQAPSVRLVCSLSHPVPN
jgi:prepilin-type N-terminal cleavage/methylation domain-containing protein